MKLFADSGCTCSTTDKLRAALEGVAEPLCAVHQPEQVAEREADAVRADAQEKAADLFEALGRVKAEDEVAARRQQAAARDAALAGIEDPMLRSLTAISGGSTLPLNLPLSSYSSLAGMTEATDHRNFDGPDAA